MRALALLCLMVPAPALAGPHADLVLRGGRVFVGQGADGHRHRRARRAGGWRWATTRRLADLIGPRTRVVELKGRLVIPGFNDAHVHFLSGGFGLLSVDLRDAKDEADLARRIGEYAKTLPRGTLDPGRELGPRGVAVEGAAHAAAHRRRDAGSSGVRLTGWTGTWRWRTAWR